MVGMRVSPAYRSFVLDPCGCMIQKMRTSMPRSYFLRTAPTQTKYKPSEDLAQPTRSSAFRVTTDSSGGHTASHAPTDIWKLGLFEIQCSQRSFIVYTTDFYTTHLLLIFLLQIYQGGWIACSLRILATDLRFLSVPLRPASKISCAGADRTSTSSRHVDEAI